MIGWSLATAKIADSSGAVFRWKQFFCTGWATSAAMRCLVHTLRLRSPFRSAHRCCTRLDWRGHQSIAGKNKLRAHSLAMAQQAKATSTKLRILLRISIFLSFSVARTTSGRSAFLEKFSAALQLLRSVASHTECLACKSMATIFSRAFMQSKKLQNERAKNPDQPSSKW